MTYVKIGALIAAIAFCVWYGDHREAAGYKAGSAAIQVKWDADKAVIEKTAEAAVAAATADKEKALADNEQIQTAYQTQLADANAAAAALAGRLHDYQVRAAAGGSSLPNTRGGLGPTPAAAPPSEGQLDGDLGNRLIECAANEAQLAALISEIKPQL
jgi:hypothetical protein